MRSKHFPLTLLTLFLLSLSPPLSAQGNDVQWHGFLSTGARHSSEDVTYIGGVKDEYSFITEYKLGLNLNYKISHELSFAAQLISKPSGPDSDFSNDWAFATYRPNSEIAFRFGKQKFPIGLISEYVDVGFAYPWIHPPDEVYKLTPIKGTYGAELEYALEIGESLLTFRIFSGESHEALDVGYENNQIIHAKSLNGLTFLIEQEELTAKASYTRTVVDIDIGNEAIEFVEDLGGTIISFGIKYENFGFLLHSEYTKFDDTKNQKQIDRLNKEAEAATAQGDTQTASEKAVAATIMDKPLSQYDGFFCTLGYQYQRTLPHYTYAQLNSPKESYGFQSQSSHAVGVKYNFTDKTDIKTEIKQVTFPDGEYGFIERASTTSTDKPDSLLIYSLGFDLVF